MMFDDAERALPTRFPDLIPSWGLFAGEGGTRVPAFVSGGFLPASQRGKSLSLGMIHIIDWYTAQPRTVGCICLLLSSALRR
jgi:hypothetical protein